MFSNVKYMGQSTWPVPINTIITKNRPSSYFIEYRRSVPPEAGIKDRDK